MASTLIRKQIQYNREPFMETIVLTPLIAAKMLNEWHYEGNRKSGEGTVISYQKRMGNGEFSAYGQMDVAECQGRKYLINGKHRLTAISQMTSDFSLVVSLRRDFLQTMEDVANAYALRDGGLVRTTAHTVYSQISNRTKLSEIQLKKTVRFLTTLGNGLRYETGNINYLTYADEHCENILALEEDILKVLSITEEDKIFANHRKKRPINKIFNRTGFLGTALAIIHLSPDKGFDFFRRMYLDEQLPQDSFEKKLFISLENFEADNIRLKAKGELPNKIADIVAMYWNAYYRGRTNLDKSKYPAVQIYGPNSPYDGRSKVVLREGKFVKVESKK